MVMTPQSTDLTPQQFRFVQEYLIDSKIVSAAAKRAGYSVKGAHNAAASLMRNPKVLAAIEEGQKEASRRMGITEDRILQELALIAFANLKDIQIQNPDGTIGVDMNAISREHAAALGELSITSGRAGRNTKVKLHDKISALEKLGKHFGMFKDRVEHSGVLTLQELVESSFEDKESE